MNTIHYTITASENTPRFGKPAPEEPRFSITVENNWTAFETPTSEKIKDYLDTHPNPFKGLYKLRLDEYTDEIEFKLYDQNGQYKNLGEALANVIEVLNKVEYN